MDVDYHCNRHFSSDDDDDIDCKSNGVDSYSLSADISESESCSSTTTLSYGISPQAGLIHLLDGSEFPCRLRSTSPVFGGMHGFNSEEKMELTEKAELSVVELMKQLFAKLLLGEDMSGGAKGVCTALAISNAITNLADSVFSNLWKLEPLIPEKKSIWLREMDWLLCVSDYIVELVPSMQDLPDGKAFEVMVTQSRRDLSVHLPALKKLNRTLLSILDGFYESEFHYVDRGTIVADGEYCYGKHYPPSPRQPLLWTEEKCWLPFPKVPSNGLSEETRKQLQQCRECTNQICKAAAAINSTVLAEIQAPKDYLDRLDMSAKACLGDILYRHITDNEFYPECLLHYIDLSSEHAALEIANRIEAAIHIWRQKYQKKKLDQRKTGRSWIGAAKGLVHIEKTKIEKTKTYAQRAETLSRNLKSEFPSLPQTALDTAKIQHNKDVGQAILESYSRVMKNLAFNLMARVDDLMYVDDATRRRTTEESASIINQIDAFALQKQVSSGPVISMQPTSCASLLTRTAFCSATFIVKKRKRRNASLREVQTKSLED